MPVPASHVRQFQALAAGFAELARCARRPQAVQVIDANTLKSISQVLSKRFLRILQTWHESSEERKKAARNIRAYLAGHGIKVPANAEVTFKDNNWSVNLCFKFKSKYLNAEGGVKYDSKNGFSPCKK